MMRPTEYEPSRNVCKKKEKKRSRIFTFLLLLFVVRVKNVFFCAFSSLFTGFWNFSQRFSDSQLIRWRAHFPDITRYFPNPKNSTINDTSRYRRTPEKRPIKVSELPIFSSERPAPFPFGLELLKCLQEISLLVILFDGSLDDSLVQL